MTKDTKLWKAKQLDQQCNHSFTHSIAYFILFRNNSIDILIGTKIKHFNNTEKMDFLSS